MRADDTALPTSSLNPLTDPSPDTFAVPKRRQVKNACTHCQKSSKKCDDNRPCLRCVTYGLQDDCRSSSRKQRPKGIKRGPYKKRDTAQGIGTATNGATASAMFTPAPTMFSTPRPSEVYQSEPHFHALIHPPLPSQGPYHFTPYPNQHPFHYHPYPPPFQDSDRSSVYSQSFYDTDSSHLLHGNMSDYENRDLSS